MSVLITGGAGFIGANFVLDWLALNDEPVINLDKLTYAGNPETLQSLQGDTRHTLVQGDIGDRALVSQLLATHQPRAIVNFAAESHVDRSIHGPGDFIHTNIVGTYELLEAVRQYWSALAAPEKAAFRFLHVSTDEVYGSLAKDAPAFTGAPTGADLLADITAHAIRQVFQQEELTETTAGIYHLVAAGETNWFEYAKHVLAQAKQVQPAIEFKVTDIQPVPTSAFPTPARRPHNSRLNTAKLQRTFGLTLPHWQVGVNRMLVEIL